MLYFFILSLAILIAYIAGIQTADVEEKWMGIEFTTSLKGIGILTVIWAHVGKQLGVPAIQFIAGVGVTLFLICSGYGMEKSFQKNGLKDFWKKRILSVYIPFVIVLVISRAIEVCFGEPFDFYSFMGGLFLIKANWYIRFIVICYIVFFAVKSISAHIKAQRFESICWLLYVLIAFIVYSTYVTDESAPFLQARQVLSFPLGVYIAQNTHEVERKIRKFDLGGGVLPAAL